MNHLEISEANLLAPGHNVRPGKVEGISELDEHVEGHQETECVGSSFVECPLLICLCKDGGGRLPLDFGADGSCCFLGNVGKPMTDAAKAVYLTRSVRPSPLRAVSSGERDGLSEVFCEPNYLCPPVPGAALRLAV
jgi:hypothetical protein